MKYVRDEANNLYEALDKAQTLAQITSAVNTEKARAMEAEAEEQAALNNKVDKVAGKGLSSNDFTDHHKEIVEQIETGSVTGLKGEKESAYRTGQVILTADNVGAAKAKDTHTNLLNPTRETQIVHGITFTNNYDGSITINGTADTNADGYLAITNPSRLPIEELGLEAGKQYALVCKGGSASSYLVNIYFYETQDGSAIFSEWAGNGVKVFTVPAENANYVSVGLRVKAAQTVKNKVVKPMLTTDLNVTYEEDEFVAYSGKGELNENVAEIYKDLKAVANLIYPVGSIYMSVNAVNPATLFGGTWVRIKDKFLLSAGDTYTNGSTGGEATHALTVAELPAHNHGLNAHTHSIPALSGKAANHGIGGMYTALGTQSFNVGFQYGGIDCGGYYPFTGGETNSRHEHTVTTNASTTGGNSGNTTNTGSGTAHNNMPPYLTVNIWKRTA